MWFTKQMCGLKCPPCLKIPSLEQRQSAAGFYFDDTFTFSPLFQTRGLPYKSHKEFLVIRNLLPSVIILIFCSFLGLR